MATRGSRGVVAADSTQHFKRLCCVQRARKGSWKSEHSSARFPQDVPGLKGIPRKFRVCDTLSFGSEHLDPEYLVLYHDHECGGICWVGR